jgi:hypothetical protein
LLDALTKLSDDFSAIFWRSPYLACFFFSSCASVIWSAGRLQTGVLDLGVCTY